MKLKAVPDIIHGSCEGCILNINKSLSTCPSQIQIINGKKYSCGSDHIIYKEEKNMNIEDLKKSVEMWVWNGVEDYVKMEIIHILPSGEVIDNNGSIWDNYEEIKEPTCRPYNETDDLSLLVGKTVKCGERMKLIIGVDASPGDINVIAGTTMYSFEGFHEDCKFLDNTPCGVKE